MEDLVKRLEREIEEFWAKIWLPFRHHHHKHPHPVRGIIFFLTSNKISFMALSFGGNNLLAIGTLGLQDVVTGLPVTPTAPFSNISVTSDTPAVATALIDAAGNVDATSVSPGTFNLTIVFTAVYNNSLGVSTTSVITLVAPGTVAQATADQVAGTITWGTPTVISTSTPATPAS